MGKQSWSRTRLLTILAAGIYAVAALTPADAVAAPCSVSLIIAAPFDADYGCEDFGSPLNAPAGFTGPLGGLTFLDNNTLLIGGSANTLSADIFKVGVTRDAGNHVTGFSGTPEFFSTAPGIAGGIDGGLAFGPGGVLFYTSFADNVLGQIKPGSSAPDKLIPLSPEGVTSTVGTLVFVPSGFPGVGDLIIVEFSGGGKWYRVPVAELIADGSGTFDIGTIIDPGLALGGGPEGVVFIKGGNPGFANDSALVTEFSTGRVSAYDLDVDGNPIIATRRQFLSGLGGAEGSVIDPLTGDFLFSTFGGGDRVIRISGFNAPEPPVTGVPAPEMLALLASGLIAFGVARRRV